MPCSLVYFGDDYVRSWCIVEEKQLADCQQAEIEQLQRKVSELQGELKSEMKHSRAVDSDAHVCTSV